MIKDLKNIFKKLTLFDKFVMIFLLSFPVLLVLIHTSGIYCNSSDIENDCPAYNLGYKGDPFWSITAITSNLIHNIGTHHILSNLIIFYIGLALGYVFMFNFMRTKVIDSLKPFSSGLLLTFIFTFFAVPFVSMLFFKQTVFFGKPTFGFSGVSYAIISFSIFTSFISYLLEVVKFKNLYVKIGMTTTIVIILLYVFLYIIDVTAAGLGNRIVHLFGILTGIIIGTIVYQFYCFSEKKSS